MEKKSQKPIPPTLRGKKRYIKFSLLCSANLSERDVGAEISNIFSAIFGASGIASQRLWLIKWFSQKNEGIVRCALPQEENVKAGLLFLQKVRQEQVIPVILKVSGSVKKLK
ncbi:MAG TPA: Rpp14/Pop5 family protein [archaeon]|nr:Rpp14/Pop5 family protein [archaeon]